MCIPDAKCCVRGILTEKGKDIHILTGDYSEMEYFCVFQSDFNNMKKGFICEEKKSKKENNTAGNI